MGLTISLVFLFLCILTFSLIRSIKSPRTTIHLHLSISLFIGTLVFLTGFSRTENKVKRLCGPRRRDEPIRGARRLVNSVNERRARLLNDSCAAEEPIQRGSCFSSSDSSPSHPRCLRRARSAVRPSQACCTSSSWRRFAGCVWRGFSSSGWWSWSSTPTSRRST